jgi:hypothetical protein
LAGPYETVVSFITLYVLEITGPRSRWFSNNESGSITFLSLLNVTVPNSTELLGLRVELKFQVPTIFFSTGGETQISFEIVGDSLGGING